MAMASAAVNAVKGGGIVLSLCRLRRYGDRRPSFLPFSRSISHPRITVQSQSTAASRRCGVFRLGPAFCTAATEAEAATPPPPSEATAVSSDSAVEVDDEVRKLYEAADMLDIRVGRVVKAWMHEEADSLYVEEVDVGEAEPRIICSGLVEYISLCNLQDRKVVVLANLKARNMRGVKSHGMLLAASDASHENVELLVPPEDSVPGERIWFGSEEAKENQKAAATANQVNKKKIWETVQPNLSTNDSGIAMLGDLEMRTSAGLVMSTSLKNANIS